MIYTGAIGFGSITYTIGVVDIADENRLCDWFIVASNGIVERYAQVTTQESNGKMMFKIRLTKNDHRLVQEFDIEGTRNPAVVFGQVFQELSNDIENAVGELEPLDMASAMLDMTTFVVNSTTEV